MLARVRVLERQMKDGLEPLRDLPHVGDVRVIGGVGIVELVRDQRTRAADGYLDCAGPGLAAECIRRGLFLRPLGNVLYFMPPYVITKEETEWALSIIGDVLKSWRPA